MSGKRIEFSFVGDASDLERALRSVQSEGREAGDEMESAGKRGAAGLSNAEKASKALKVGLGAIAVAAAAAAVATSKIISATIDLSKRADEIAKKAKAIGGVTAEELQILTGALELGGVQAETTANAIQKLNINLGEASEKTGPAHDALTKLKLTFEELEALPLAERIATIADRLSEFESDAIRSTIAQDLLGRGAMDMLAAFTEGGDAIRESSKLIKDAGVISNETARQGEELADALALMKRRANALRDQALAPLMPVLKDLSENLSETMDSADPQQFRDMGLTVSRILIDVVAPGVVMVGRELAKATLSIGLAGEAVGEWVQRAKDFSNIITLTAQASIASQKLNLGEAKKLALEAKLIADRIEFSGMDIIGRLSDSAAGMGADIATIDDAAEILLETLRKTSAEIGKLAEEAGKSKKKVGGLGEDLDEAGAAAQGVTDDIGDLLEIMADMDEAWISAFKSADRALDDLANEMLDRDLDEIFDVGPRFDKEQAESARQQAISLAQDVANATLDIMSQVTDQILADRTAAAEETADRLKDVEKRIAGAATDTERARLFEHRNMLKERQAIQREEVLEAWHVSQAFAISQAVINAAAGIAMQLAGTPGPPAFILAAIAGAMGAAQVAAIAAEPPPQFHAGGMIGSQMRAHDEVNIRARAGEAVLSPQGVAAAGGAGGVNALNAGGGAGGANVTVFQVGHRAVDAMIHESLRRPSGRLTRELRAVRPRRVGRYNPYRS